MLLINAVHLSVLVLLYDRFEVVGRTATVVGWVKKSLKAPTIEDGVSRGWSVGAVVE